MGCNVPILRRPLLVGLILIHLLFLVSSIFSKGSSVVLLSSKSPFEHLNFSLAQVLGQYLLFFRTF